MMLGLSAFLRTTTITTIILVYPETNYTQPDNVRSALWQSIVAPLTVR
jgi:hypothetical protein